MANKRNISDTDAKQLYLFSGNNCANPVCKNHIFSEDGANIGKIAHIVGLNITSNRHDKRWSEDKLNHYSNLVLLCGICHDIVDFRENEKKYPATMLRKWKEDHENKYKDKFKTFISNETSVVWDEKFSPKFPTDYSIACDKLKLGDENLEWLEEKLHQLANSLTDLSLSMRKTLVLIIDKGFKHNLKVQSIVLNHFIDSLDSNSQELARKHIDRLAYLGWITINYAYDEDEETTIYFRSVRYDELGDVLKSIFKFIPKDEINKLIIELDFSLGC